jgi:exodeoxyribonuclease VII small subunit
MKPEAGAEDAAYDAMTFEQLVEALEALTDRMASGSIGIEEAADLYERAGRLHALAAARLERVQERIDRLKQS